MTNWLSQHGAIDPSKIVATSDIHRGRGTEGEHIRHLAVFLKPLVVLNTQKWFGDADLRLDVIAVHGGAGDVADIYQPRTLRFPRVKDGDDLASMENGILIYYGKPSHFLVFSVLLARDRNDSDDLAKLIGKETHSPELAASLGALTAAALPAVPHLAAIKAGVGAALTLGDLAYKLVRAVSPKCLGLFRASWLGERDNFGVGRHPPVDYEEVRDFRLSYTITRDKAGGKRS